MRAASISGVAKLYVRTFSYFNFLLFSFVFWKSEQSTPTFSKEVLLSSSPV